MKFHQALFIFAVLCSFVWNYMSNPDKSLAYVLGATTGSSLLLAFLIFGWAFVNDKLFPKPKAENMPGKEIDKTS